MTGEQHGELCHNHFNRNTRNHARGLQASSERIGYDGFHQLPPVPHEAGAEVASPGSGQAQVAEYLESIESLSHLRHDRGHRTHGIRRAAQSSPTKIAETLTPATMSSSANRELFCDSSRDDFSTPMSNSKISRAHGHAADKRHSHRKRHRHTHWSGYLTQENQKLMHRNSQLEELIEAAAMGQKTLEKELEEAQRHRLDLERLAHDGMVCGGVAVAVGENSDLRKQLSAYAIEIDALRKEKEELEKALEEGRARDERSKVQIKELQESRSQTSNDLQEAHRSSRLQAEEFSRWSAEKNQKMREVLALLESYREALDDLHKDYVSQCREYRDFVAKVQQQQRKSTSWLQAVDVQKIPQLVQQIEELADKQRHREQLAGEIVKDESVETEAAQYPFFSQHDGYISEGGDLLQETMTVGEAKRKCKDLGFQCAGFCHKGPPTDEAVEILFKDNCGIIVGDTQWTSYKDETFSVHGGFIVEGSGELLRERMTIVEAKRKCKEFNGACAGFYHEGPPTDDVVEIIFKETWETDIDESTWTSYRDEAIATSKQATRLKTFGARVDTSGDKAKVETHREDDAAARTQDEEIARSGGKRLHFEDGIVRRRRDFWTFGSKDHAEVTQILVDLVKSADGVVLEKVSKKRGVKQPRLVTLIKAGTASNASTGWSNVLGSKSQSDSRIQLKWSTHLPQGRDTALKTKIASKFRSATTVLYSCTLDLLDVICIEYGIMTRSVVLHDEQPWLCFSLHTCHRSFDFICPDEDTTRKMVLAISRFCNWALGAVHSRHKFECAKAWCKILEHCFNNRTTPALLFLHACRKAAECEQIYHRTKQAEWDAERRGIDLPCPSSRTQRQSKDARRYSVEYRKLAF